VPLRGELGGGRTQEVARRGAGDGKKKETNNVVAEGDDVLAEEKVGQTTISQSVNLATSSYRHSQAYLSSQSAWSAVAEGEGCDGNVVKKRPAMR
jgi:hypothetical protein